MTVASALDEFRRDKIPGRDIEQRDPFGADQGLQNSIGQRCQSVPHHHRTTRQGQFRRDGARARQRHRGCHHGVALGKVALHNVNAVWPACDTGLGQLRYGRCDRDNHMEVGSLGLQASHGIFECRQNAIDLAKPTARQYQQDRLVRASTNLASQPHRIRVGEVYGQGRVPDKGYR